MGVPVSMAAWERDPVEDGSMEAVVLQAATNRIGITRDARVRMFFKDSYPLLVLAREADL
jgi:hypothetical protein